MYKLVPLYKTLPLLRSKVNDITPFPTAIYVIHKLKQKSNAFFTNYIDNISRIQKSVYIACAKLSILQDTKSIPGTKIEHHLRLCGNTA